ncbi:MAG: L,D-transpeptidase [Verrucomicrobiota bacterium]
MRLHPLLRHLARASLVTTALWLSACKTTPPTPPEPVPQPPAKPVGLFEWKGEGKSVTSIRINVDEQMAYLFNGEEQIGWTYVATGIPSFPTPTGDFKVMEKVSNKVSNLYGKGYDANGKLVNSDFKQGRDVLPAGGRFDPAKMPYFMRLTGDGVGMHIGPIPRPGKRASHGCIRLPSKVAGDIFKSTAIGTPVKITGSGPDYQTYLKQSAEKSKANAAKYANAKKKAADAATAAADAVALPPGDPNGPVPTPGTAPAAPEATPAGTTPAPTPAPPPEEIKPAAPAPAPGN